VRGADPDETGRVVAVHGRHFRIEDDSTGRHLDCVTRGKKTGIACGDRVRFRATAIDGGVIEETLPRRNLLYRSDQFRSKLLAANVDQVFIVLAASPSPNFELLDRCLVACEGEGIPAAIVVNKADLPETSELLDRLALYARLGYTLIPLSARQDASPLASRLAEKTSILVGASGVGKSTLVNALVPAAEIATQEISEALDSGKHTTTHTRLYALPGGGSLIDSPGMQEFGLRQIEVDALAATFPEFRPLLGQCRFYNCRHLQEPGCAILTGVETGDLDARRWRVYRDLVGENGKTIY